MTELPASEIDAVVAATRTWIERAVIGLHLCPFAKTVYAAERIRYCVSAACDEDGLLHDLEEELSTLCSTPEHVRETTLLIHPRVLTDFTDYNAFLDAADRAIESLGLRGEIQIASFHPRYRFAGTTPDDIGNFTNRSPHPMLHLLREASVERAVAAGPDAAAILDHNIETMRCLGHEGWQRMFPSA